MNKKIGSKPKGKGDSKGKNQEGAQFRMATSVFFLTYKEISDSGQRLTKQSLAAFLMSNPNDDLVRPRGYIIAKQTYKAGPSAGMFHYHAIVFYQRRKGIKTPDYFDHLGIHPNLSSMRNLKAAILYLQKEGLEDLYTNLDLDKQYRAARAKDTSSLYQLLEQQMKKDPFNFDAVKFATDNDLTKQMYNAGYAKAFHLIKLVRQAYCNKLLYEKPGIMPITRALIEEKLSPSQLAIYDSWGGYQVIVDHLNQVPRYRFRRPMKTMNLLITGPKSIGKSALVWQQYSEPHLNPLSAHCSVYPMGMKDWFPRYKSQVYDLIYWNQAKLTSYSFDLILQLLDGNPIQLPSKGGGHKKVDNPLVIMTSNMTLDAMIKQKYHYSKQYQAMARQNLSVRVTNVVVPADLNLFLLQKLLVPPLS